MSLSRSLVVTTGVIVAAGTLSFLGGIRGSAAKALGKEARAQASQGTAMAGRASGKRDPLDLKSIDPKVKACTDFYLYANAGWLAHHSIPPEYPMWGRMNELIVRNRSYLRKILESAADKNAAKGSTRQKIGDYYASCMDRQAINAAGIKPIGPELKRIEQLHTMAGLQAEIAHLQKLGANVLFAFSSMPDLKNSSRVIGDADQGGLGLPNCTYYTKQDAKSKRIRHEYVAHITKMFELLGDDDGKAAAEGKTVMQIETGLAKASLTPVERRNPQALYHKMDPSQLKRLTPSFDWRAYFGAIGHPGIEAVNVDAPAFLKEMNKDLTAVSLANWKTYLRWHLINRVAADLSTPFVEEDFNFKGKILTGSKVNLPRWQRCVRATDRQLGFALGKVYVQKYFPPEAKRRADEMVHNLMATLHDDIQALPWMEPKTKKAALAKLRAMTPKIGYPNKWRDYSALTVDRGPFVENVFRASQFEFNRETNKIGKPVDRTEWDMTPQTINAYYNPLKNEIVFPAGILQPPFFNAKADDAVNYGAIGAIIGHEMTHGFDDEGRQFDAKGNLADWWTPEDQRRFQARGQCIVDEFNSFAVGKGLHENGKLVEGESIADLGGATIAYEAFEKSLEGKPRPPKIDGFTPEQRFFLSGTQTAAVKYRPEFVQLLVNTDPHPLFKFRVLGIVSNMPAFAKAFHCKAGDAMVRPEGQRCRIW